MKLAGDACGTDITFTVEGINGQAQTVSTDTAGRAQFPFTSPQDPSGLGEDTITVSIEVDGESKSLTFNKRWVDTTPPEQAMCAPVSTGGTRVAVRKPRSSQCGSPSARVWAVKRLGWPMHGQALIRGRVTGGRAFVVAVLPSLASLVVPLVLWMLPR